MIPEKYRAYLYRLASAAAAVGVAYGVISDAKATLWLSVVGAAISGLAAVNTSTSQG